MGVANLFLIELLEREFRFDLFVVCGQQQRSLRSAVCGAPRVAGPGTGKHLVHLRSLFFPERPTRWVQVGGSYPKYMNLYGCAALENGRTGQNVPISSQLYMCACEYKYQGYFYRLLDQGDNLCHRNLRPLFPRMGPGHASSSVPRLSRAPLPHRAKCPESAI